MTPQKITLNEAANVVFFLNVADISAEDEV